MRRPLGILLAATAVAIAALLAIAARSTPARVLRKDERVVVLSSTGQWYHRYAIIVGIPDASTMPGTVRDSFGVSVTRETFDAARVGAHVRLGHLALLPAFSWMADSTSVLRTLVNIAMPHLRHYYNAAPVSPLSAQTAGLARVVSVHSVQRRHWF